MIKKCALLIRRCSDTLSVGLSPLMSGGLDLNCASTAHLVPFPGSLVFLRPSLLVREEWSEWDLLSALGWI